MFALPLCSILLEIFVLKSATSVVSLLEKWFVFWGVGARLFTAGLRQAIDPRFTAEEIFHFNTEDALIVIQELGFANIAIGLAGLLAVFNMAWVVPVAVAGTVFYGLAGIRHVFAQRNRIETIAMATDLWMFVVLLAYLALIVITPA